jgi:hypothetical protein
LPGLLEQGVPREVEVDCWVGEAVVLGISARYEVETAQQVAEIRDSYMMIMKKKKKKYYYVD